MNSNSIVVITTDELERRIQQSIERALISIKTPEPILEKPDITDINGAVEVTGLSKSTIYQKGNKMPKIFTPKKILFSRKALQEWVESGMPDVSKMEAAESLSEMVNKRRRRY